MVKRQKGEDPKRKGRSGQSGNGEVPLPAVIGARLRSLRARHRYSLEKLAELANVSRAMLSQIENGQSVPTIVLLMKVADALEVPLTMLVSEVRPQQAIALPRVSAKLLSVANGHFTLRPLFPDEHAVRAEFYEAVIAAGHVEHLDPRAGGTKENFVVVRGRLELTVGNEPTLLLAEGDAAFVESADNPRTVCNPSGDEAVFHLVIDRLNAFPR